MWLLFLSTRPSIANFSSSNRNCILSFFKGITVKELEDLINMQKRLLTKLREECRILNEQLELLAIKYK